MAEITITQANFDEEVLKSDKPVLLDFWATWCGPCRMLAPEVAALAEARPDIKVGKVNVDDEGELAVRFGISSIPTVIVFKNGDIAAQEIGFRPRAELEALLDR